MSLPALLAAATYDGHALTAAIEPEWLQGRTTYGGLSTMIACAAALRCAPDLPPLRSVQAAFVGPVADRVRAEATLLRRGKNSAFIACDVSGDTGIGLRALFVFAAARESALRWPALDLESVAPRGDRIALPAGAPRFMGNFEIADAGGQPLGGLRRWMRLATREGIAPVLELIAIADALPPAAVALVTSFGPVSTMTWQLNLLTDTPATDDGWWLIEAITLDANAGTSSQAMTIWNRSGQAVATATQSVALFF